MHNEYENASKKAGWETQVNCRVKFDDLPKENKKVMLIVAEAMINKLKEIQSMKLKEMNELMHWMGGN